jgi:hypothetical protein
MPMNIEQFRRMIQAPERTQQELEQTLRNVVDRNDRDRAQEVKSVLDSRFAGWDKPSARRGGATETIVRWGSTRKDFTTAKEAYLWLVERFSEANPQLFTDIRWGTTGYVAVGKRRGAAGVARNYFSRQPGNLFRAAAHLADDPNNFHRLSNGWYVNTNLSNAEKFEILCRFGGVSKLEYERDWEWEVLDPSDALVARKARVALAEEVFAELERALSAQRGDA